MALSLLWASLRSSHPLSSLACAGQGFSWDDGDWGEWDDAELGQFYEREAVHFAIANSALSNNTGICGEDANR